MLLKETLIDQLRDDLRAANYLTDEVQALLGEAANQARLRGVFAAARKALAKASTESALATLTRLFLLGESVNTVSVDGALSTLGSAGAQQLGLIEATADGWVAQLSLNPVQLPDPLSSRLNSTVDWCIVSDLDDQLRRGPARQDHVMGVGGATRSLVAQLSFAGHVTWPRFESALDLGTGCGVVAMCLAHAGVQSVVATDISERALMMARANARLNGMLHRIEFRQGDLFEPVAGETFDCIASNPPFVITPRSGDDEADRYEYRDGGMTGDALAERVVREAPEYLAAGGTFVCLANWESIWGTSGLDRVREWVQGAADSTGALGAWVIERDRLDPERYAETWARDGGARPGDTEFELMMAAWLDDFTKRRVTAIGLGSIRILKLQGQKWHGIELDSTTSVRTEHASEPLAEVGLGGFLDSTFLHGLAVDRMPDEDILSQTWLRTETVDEVREHAPGEQSPRAIWLRTKAPLTRSVVADTILASAVGACDGDLCLGQINDALATILEVDPEACAEALVQGVRELVWLGMLQQAPAPVAR